MYSKFQMRCTSLVVVSGDQEQYYIRSTWHSQECNWEGSGQSDIPPVEASRGQEQYYIRSALHLFAHFIFTSWQEYRYIWSFEECNWQGNFTFCRIPFRSQMTVRQTPQKHSQRINTRQVTQISYATLYKHLPLLSLQTNSLICFHWQSSVLLHQGTTFKEPLEASGG